MKYKLDSNKTNKKTTPKTENKKKQTKQVSQSTNNNNNVIEKIKDELNRQQERVSRDLVGFKKVAQEKKLTEGRKAFIASSLVEFKAKRDVIDSLLKWLDTLKE